MSDLEDVKQKACESEHLEAVAIIIYPVIIVFNGVSWYRLVLLATLTEKRESRNCGQSFATVASVFM